MKLYVDDLRSCPEGWQLARTITEAVRILATRHISDVSLDHDILHHTPIKVSGQLLVAVVSNETFEPVAWFLAVTRFPGKITLHTANPIGAKKMAEILADAGLESETVLGMPVNGLE